MPIETYTAAELLPIVESKIPTAAAPAPTFGHLWWELHLDGIGRMTLPDGIHEFDIQRQPNLSAPWTHYARTNRPPVKVTNGYYRVGQHLKT